MAAIVAEIRALRRDVQNNTDAALRFSGTPISKIAWGFVAGNVLLWVGTILLAVIVVTILSALGLATGTVA